MEELIAHIRSKIEDAVSTSPIGEWKSLKLEVSFDYKREDAGIDMAHIKTQAEAF